MSIPSENLEGLTLPDGWLVTEKITKRPNATGGRFSCGYKITKGDEIAYLKALDFSEAFTFPDVPRRLQELTEAYNFERNLLKKCKEKRLKKIVSAISDGSIQIPGFPPDTGRVYYIIFDFADGDIRKVKDTFSKINLAFTFRALHNTAVGLEQLHSHGIAHQDLKPSNILAFPKDYRISDLGRSSDKEISFINDKFPMPGDRNYSPIEQRYGYHFSNDFNERFAADMYLFGSLFFFFFTGLTCSQAIRNKATALKISITNDFLADISEWERVFSEVLVDLKKTIKSIIADGEVVDEVCYLVKYLCYPDPRKRGYPQNIGVNMQQYSFERFISRLDFLARKAEYDLI